MRLTPDAARDVALEVAARASDLLREGWGHAGRAWSKEQPGDLVTEWDQRAETLIIEELARRAPGIPILGEEGGARGAAGAEADERWLVDPIDGTVNFAHAFPLFAVSIGYEQRGEPVAGVVAAPALGWTFAAAAGAGATRDGQPIRVSGTARLDQGLLVTGFPYDLRVSPVNNLEQFAHMQRASASVRRLGSAALDLCFVAAGWLDGYWEFKLKPWDLSAGACIVREAGGRVTALDGAAFSSETGEIVASNGLIHDAMVSELLRVPAPRP
jgi:myo-inositol-1(or 4)-monophosphatase